jgi:hypothetical protein
MDQQLLNAHTVSDMANRARKLELLGRTPRPAPRLVRLERQRLGDDHVAELEARSIGAALLGDLPAAATLYLRVPGHDGLVAIATSAERAELERGSGMIVFDAAEWGALVVAAESDRVWPADLREICARKAGAADWALDLETALGGARADAPRGWSVGRVLDRIGAELVQVQV